MVALRGYVLAVLLSVSMGLPWFYLWFRAVLCVAQISARDSLQTRLISFLPSWL